MIKCFRCYLFLLLVSCPCFIPEAASAESDIDKPYTIGAILPLTGESASIGKYVKNGFDLAYSDLSAEQKKKIKLIYEDDQLKHAKSVSAFQKLSNINKIDAAFVLGSGVGNVVGPLAERKKKLMVSIGASDKKFAAGTEYVFIHWVSPEEEARTMLSEIKKRGYQRVILVSHEQEGIIALTDVFLDAAKQSGFSKSILTEIRVMPSERDFRPLITKIRAKKADGVLVTLLPGALAAFIKQASTQGLGAELFGFELFEDEAEVKASGGTLVGKWYVNGDDATAAFAKHYKDTYKEHPGWGSSNAYDTLKLVAEAVDKHGANSKKIADYLRTVENYSGAAGNYSASGDNRFQLPAAVKVVTETGFKKLY